MRKAIIISFLFAVNFVSLEVAPFPQERSESSELRVHSDNTQCVGASFYSIQDAIDAAHPGDTVHVCQGEYPEQIIINKPLTIVADAGATLVESHMIKNASSLSNAEPLSAAILVRGAENVDVMGFTVDASRNEISGCSPRLIGILYQNASGKITGNNIRHVKLDSPLSTCVSGNAIEIQSGDGGHSEVDVHDNAVDDYQKNAVTANGQGTHVGIDENEITTSDPVERPSQVGIQVGFGATGVIENNTIVADLSVDAPPSRCAPNTVGVLVYKSDGIFIVANSIESKQIGILVAGNQAKITGNNFSKCSPTRGIVLLGNGSEVNDNELPSGGQVAVLIHGSKNSIQRNQRSDASRYTVESSGPENNLISDNVLSLRPAQAIPIPLTIGLIPSK